MGPPLGSTKQSLTTDQINAYLANPVGLLQQQFIHRPSVLEECAFIVVGLNISEDGMSFQVRFSRWTDSMDVDEMDMKQLLEESLVVG
jgi:hypothetical protein